MVRQIGLGHAGVEVEEHPFAGGETGARMIDDEQVEGLGEGLDGRVGEGLQRAFSQITSTAGCSSP